MSKLSEAHENLDDWPRRDWFEYWFWLVKKVSQGLHQSQSKVE